MRIESQLGLFNRPGLIVDLFAGGGGWGCGQRRAIGRDADIAINHDRAATVMYKANHPDTRVLQGNVWHYAPLEVTRGRRVDWLHGSPTCTDFSQAKGGPLNREEATRIRALAWVLTRWAKEVRPTVISAENVGQFASWGPLANDGRPCPFRRGKTFRAWVRALEKCGYRVEWRMLRACDYGAPTTRERLFVMARCDGEEIRWPAPTHGPGLLPYRTAAECIDWSIEAPSIFGRSLSAATLARIEHGLRRFVLDCADPFVVDGRLVPWLIHQSNGERKGQAPRIYNIEEPLRTIVAGGIKHALVYALIAKHYGGHSTPGLDLRGPLSTITTKDHHALVVAGINDICMRSLVSRELFRCQGFPEDWVIDPIVNGKPLSKTAQVRLCGNSVAPDPAEALVRANSGAERRMAA